MKTPKTFTILPEITLPGYQGAAYYLLNARGWRGVPLPIVGTENTPKEGQPRPIIRAIVCRTVEHDIAVFRWAKASGTNLLRKRHCAWTVYISPGIEVTETIIREIIL